MIGLTPKQAKCLNFIRMSVAKSGGAAPSFAEIGFALNVASKSTVHRLVHGLAERGAITMVQNSPRSISVVGYDFSGLDHHTSDHLRAMRARIDEILKGRAQ